MSAFDPAEAFNDALDAIDDERPDDARKALRHVLETTPTDHEARLILARLERELGDDRAASAHVAAILQVMPHHIEALVELADLRLEAGDAEACAHAVQQVLRVEPNHWDATRLLGDAFSDVGAFSEAARAYETALASNPFSAQVWFNLGHAREQIEDPEGAAVALRGYLRCFPDADDRPQVEARIERLEVA